jgi:FMN phosphatase YigB (HAD superfamily)
MISNPTRQQLANLKIDSSKPLLICDVDEVVVHFTSNFEHFLSQRRLWLEPTSLALSGNIKNIDDNTIIAQSMVENLIDEFFVERTRTLSPIKGAVSALKNLGHFANVVMLTNLPHFAKDDRTANLADLGLAYPVITNSGPKGPAIKHLAGLTSQPIVFVDDSPHFISSAFEHAPHVHLIHFLQDERFSVHVPHYDYVSLRTADWAEAEPHITTLLLP